MDARLAESLKQAAAAARRHALAFPGAIARDDLPWAVVKAFDDDIRGHIERDRSIEAERDRVLIAAVNLAETRPDDGADAFATARTDLVDAIDYLEQAVLRFGIVNGRGAKLGLGEAGQRVAASIVSSGTS